MIDRAAAATDDPHRIAKRRQPTRVMSDGGLDAAHRWRAGIVEYGDPFHGLQLRSIRCYIAEYNLNLTYSGAVIQSGDISVS